MAILTTTDDLDPHLRSIGWLVKRMDELYDARQGYSVGANSVANVICLALKELLVVLKLIRVLFGQVYDARCTRSTNPLIKHTSKSDTSAHEE